VQTVRHESEFGVWQYVTRAPGPALARLMFRELIGFRQEQASFASWLEAPRPALTMMIDLEAEPARWADIALAAGYCDQSHLNRDFRELAGTTPSDFLARQIPGGGVVGDEIPFVQD
jgi:AraC-like DNA-binding protein